LDLFSIHEEEARSTTAPLATRMRPQTLEDLEGQADILGPGKLLRRSIESDRLSSLILYGPPGTGKTTIAQIIARHTKSRFETLSAVTSGVADIRRVVDQARDLLGRHDQRTTLFIDEIHRFNKAQQDALLPHVEEGLILLIGATTENPFFEVNPALLSRSQLFCLHPLAESALTRIAKRALSDMERGLGGLGAVIDDDALDHLIRYSDGDARRLLNALELATLTTPPDGGGDIRITLHVAEQSIQQRAVRYDRDGDAHYDTISAFIKSIRGSDPDAALFWLARMLEAGEDPKFIARRLVISASEDIGNADPAALGIAVAAFQAFELLGLPEGKIPLAQATAYLASTDKSNAAYVGLARASEAIRAGASTEIPMHLRDAHYKGAGKLGHGDGYLYPHDYNSNYVPQTYLPDELVGNRFYEATRNGGEKRLADLLIERRSRSNRVGNPRTKG